MSGRCDGEGESGKKELDTFAGAAAKKFSIFLKNRTVRESARRENLREGSESPLPFLYFRKADVVHFARLRHPSTIANLRTAILFKSWLTTKHVCI